MLCWPSIYQRYWWCKCLLAAELAILALLVHQALALAALLSLNRVLSVIDEMIKHAKNEQRIKTSGGGHSWDPPAARRSPHVSRISETDLENSVLSMSETLSAKTCEMLIYLTNNCRRRSLPEPLRPRCRCRPRHQVLSGTSSHGRAAEKERTGFMKERERGRRELLQP